jgi:hypothetical protein
LERAWLRWKQRFKTRLYLNLIEYWS